MKRIRIFISSVQSEFAEERAMLSQYIRTDALLGKFFETFIFEDVPANEASPQQVYLNEVEMADIYLGLYGNNYGYEDEEGVSPTEREYDRAAELHKTRLVFIKSIDEEHRHSKEATLIRKVERDIVRKTFVDTEGLRTSVYASLVRYLEEKEYIRWQPFDAAFDTNAKLDDLDEDKMREFIVQARAKRNFPLSENSSPEKLLAHLSLMDDKGRIANSAILLFGKRPQRFFITSEVKCVQFFGNVVEKPLPAYQICRGTLFEMIDQATAFVMDRVDLAVGTRAEGKTASVPTDYVVNLCKDKGLKSPEYHQEEDFRVVIWRRGGQTDNVSIKGPSKGPSKGLSRDQVCEHLNQEWNKIDPLIRGLEKASSAAELRALMGMNNATKFKKNYLDPLIELGIVRMTDPDSPNSPKQRYVLTDTAKGFLL